MEQCCIPKTSHLTVGGRQNAQPNFFHQVFFYPNFCPPGITQPDVDLALTMKSKIIVIIIYMVSYMLLYNTIYIIIYIISYIHTVSYYIIININNNIDIIIINK